MGRKAVTGLSSRMGKWASGHIERLRAGETVQFRPRGNSMKGKVDDGSLVTVEPVGDRELSKGMIVLCQVRGNQYLHLIKAARNGKQFQIGNNRGGINGWVTRESIFGICTKVEP